MIKPIIKKAIANITSGPLNLSLPHKASTDENKSCK